MLALLSNEVNMAIGCEPSEICCNNEMQFGAAYISKQQFTLGFKKASLLIFQGYVNEIRLLVISMFSEPVKFISVNKIYTSVLVYVFKTSDDNPSPIASISASL